MGVPPLLQRARALHVCQRLPRRQNICIRNLQLKSATESCIRPVSRMAGEEGLEPSHAGIKIRCLDQLGDSPTRLHLQPGLAHYSDYTLLRIRYCKFFHARSSAQARNGCSLRLPQTQPVQCVGKSLMARCATTGVGQGQKTQAPEPLILASPKRRSHSTARPTSGNRVFATASRSL